MNMTVVDKPRGGNNLVEPWGDHKPLCHVNKNDGYLDLKARWI